jgi:iron-sulfur cluster assembly accessory protein
MEHAVHDRALNQTHEQLLVITDSAVEMVTQAMKQADMNTGGVRIAVTGGGCEGFQYSLSLTNTARSNDEMIVQKGITAFLDPRSAQHLRGTTLDYVSNRHGTGFHFFGIESLRTIGCESSMLLRRCMAGNTRTTGCTNSAKRPLMALTQEVELFVAERRTSVAHPGLRPRSICPTCRYVVCRCQEAA